MMKLMARTSERSYQNNYKGEDWAEVTETMVRTPSGLHKAFRFPSGYAAKADRCEVAYVFEK